MRWDHGKQGRAVGRDRQLQGQKRLYGQGACAGGRAAAVAQEQLKPIHMAPFNCSASVCPAVDRACGPAHAHSRTPGLPCACTVSMIEHFSSIRSQDLLEPGPVETEQGGHAAPAYPAAVARPGGQCWRQQILLPQSLSWMHVPHFPQGHP